MAEPRFGQWPPNVIRSEVIFDGSNGGASILKADTGKIVTSVTRTGAGVYDLVLNQDLGTLAFWAVFVGLTTAARMASYAFVQATNTLTVTVYDAAGAAADSAFVSVLITCGTPGAAA